MDDAVHTLTALLKRIVNIMGTIACAMSIAACGGNGSDVTGTAVGWHFQGIDCLSCHNVDLSEEKRLTVAGTVFLNPAVGDTYDLSNVCNGPMRIQFLDTSFNVKYDSINYEDQSSRGYKGKGNIFILKRKLASLNGIYFIRILSEDGVQLAQSLTPHSFTAYFDSLNPSDLNNRYSCNACHSKNPSGGAVGGIYAQDNVNKCQ